jgi:hypothetical protein
MALPFLAPLLDPHQFPEKKMTQRTLFGRIAPPTHETAAFKEHFCGFNKDQYHMRRVKVKPNANKKKSKTINSKKKTGKPKNIVPFQKCKMTARRVSSWHALCTPRS